MNVYRAVNVLVICSLLSAPSFTAINSMMPETSSATSFPSCIPSLNQERYDLVIIAPEIFSSELQPLVAHKSSRGLSTKLVLLDEIYNGTYFPVHGRDNPERIKYFIKEAIEHFETRFVLLVGGAEQLPGRYTHIYYDDFTLYHTPNEWVFLSDLYYADIYDATAHFSSWDTNQNDVFGEYDWHGNTDDIDLYPDISLGRLACIDTTEVTTCVNKIIAYETGESYTQNWFTNIVAIGGDSLPGDAAGIDEGEYVQRAVFEIMDGFLPVKIWASTGGLNQAANINDAIDAGAGFVFFNGHGNLDVWGTHPHENANEWLPPGFYRNTHIHMLTNRDRLPIVISDACYHCTYDVRDDCFGWTFMTHPQGGAIAFLGGTDIDLSYGGTDIITKGVEKLCLELSMHYINGAATFGELWSTSITTYLSTADMDQIDRITVMESQPFGDPSLAIASQSQPPRKPDRPSGASSGKAGTTYPYTTSTIDPDGDQVFYLFDWGDGNDSGWTGPYASEEVVNISYTWTGTGTFEIKAKAKDENGIQSEWSDPLAVSMPLPHRTLLARILERILYLFRYGMP
ncbi:MAG: C25 family cysteine peptidase [Thermoplasmatota archaeon]